MLDFGIFYQEIELKGAELHKILHKIPDNCISEYPLAQNLICPSEFDKKLS
jgi:hypothetical protein